MGVFPPNNSDINVCQLDGNVSVVENVNNDEVEPVPEMDRIPTASSLPTIATYNLRSLKPKIKSLKTDIIERKIDVAFLQEIWEKSEDPLLESKIEKMFELTGLVYFSCPRPLDSRGRAYGGSAIVVNSCNFELKKLLDVKPPKDLEVTWGLIKPKTQLHKFKQILICSFYSPPSKHKNLKLAEYLTTTLHMLYTKYPNSGIIMGADRNYMDISPLLKCGLKLRQIVDKKTRKNSIIDVLIMNLASYYESPIIAPPIGPDNPLKAEPSDHSVPVCYPHLSRHDRPVRNRKIVKFRPLPESNIIQFGQWIVSESWSGIDKSQSTSQQAHSLEHTLKGKVESIFPLKTKRLSSHDKPFITSEIKKIDRQRSREYVKNGKSVKYMRLKKLFNEIHQQLLFIE